MHHAEGVTNNELPPLDESTIADLDAGIRDVVLFLRKHGFDTHDSGDGQAKFDADGNRLMVCALDAPNVFIEVPACDVVVVADRLRDLLTSVGVKVGSNSDTEVTVQAMYDCASGKASVMLWNLTSSMLAEAMRQS